MVDRFFSQWTDEQTLFSPYTYSADGVGGSLSGLKDGAMVLFALIGVPGLSSTAQKDSIVITFDGEALPSAKLDFTGSLEGSTLVYRAVKMLGDGSGVTAGNLTIDCSALSGIISGGVEVSVDATVFSYIDQATPINNWYEDQSTEFPPQGDTVSLVTPAGAAGELVSTMGAIVFPGSVPNDAIHLQTAGYALGKRTEILFVAMRSAYAEPGAGAATWGLTAPYNGIFVQATYLKTIDPCDASFNCECEADPKAQTLADLRARVVTALGFVSPPAAVAGTTLGTLKTYLMRRLGFGAQSANPPPGMAELMTELANEAQDTLWRRYAYGVYSATAPTAMVDDTDTCSLDAMAIKLLALANAKAHYGSADAKVFYDQYQVYLKELLERSPINLDAVVNGVLQTAQSSLYRQYDSLKTERFFVWTMVPGQRYYGIYDNEACCSVDMDPYKITGVWIEDAASTWYELAEGISPALYTTADQTGRPCRYEVRQCIEVFPAPTEAVKLRIKGHFPPSAFVADTDKTSIDAEAVYLWATGMAKRHYGQADADDYFRQAQTYVQKLVAGSHGTARYIPGTEPAAVLPRPTMTKFIN